MREIKFRAWDEQLERMIYLRQFYFYSGIGVDWEDENGKEWEIELDQIMQYTGLKDKNGKEIYEGDIIGKEDVYHFIEREGWKPKDGLWKIIGQKSKNFSGKGEEKYIAGYELRIVEWKNSSCGFEPFSDSVNNCGHCGGGDSPSNYEVLGNIYENKDLIIKL